MGTILLTWGPSGITWHVFGVHFGCLGAFWDALGFHFGVLGVMWAHPGCLWSIWDAPGAARGPQDVLFEAPVRAAALLCWGQAARLGGPGIQHPSKVGSKIGLLSPTSNISDIRKVTINMISAYRLAGMDLDL